MCTCDAKRAAAEAEEGIVLEILRFGCWRERRLEKNDRRSASLGAQRYRSDIHGLFLCLLQMEDERSAKLFLFIYAIRIVISVLSSDTAYTPPLNSQGLENGNAKTILESQSVMNAKDNQNTNLQPWGH